MDRNVAVVIVTYGERIVFVTKVINQLLNMNYIEKIIVVNNGNSKKYESDNKNILSLDIDFNSGSANGFYEGLKKAVEEKVNYIWMLDDDNLPEEKALEKLLDDYDKSNDKIVFSAFREDRTELKIAGYQKYIKNSFFGFSIFDKLSSKEVDNSAKFNLRNFIPCETVPYGGLLLRVIDIRKIGFPNRDFYLYNDDNDYTYRLTKNGYKIFCDSNVLIKDLESSWYRRENVPMFKAFFVTSLIKNGKYTIRNRTYFELNNIVGNKLFYILNILVYLCYVFIFYMPKNREGLKRFFIILNMIAKGFKGELGRLE